ncbi:MAG: HU family DNA-binding protein [Candidatus Auribacterota bacterium]|uniref:Integration host factor subunit beta n=1 Tax=Candidatus Auribacter fodinae TaxID=2093366 RepID=A0A3A4R696_9BACT|nr:MAG: integration host factor subunit beta [Candidatus Auribacter fodinae]
MTKRDLVVRISKETGLTQQAVFAIIQKTLDIIIETLQNGESVEFRNFGVFKVAVRNERQGINPNHPEEKIMIPSKKVVTFKQGKKMKEFVHN